MRQKIDVNAAITVIEAAFAPLQCVAESDDFSNKIEFRIYGPDGNGIAKIELSKAQFSDVDRLNTILDSLRDELIRKGFQLRESEPRRP